MTSQSHNQWHRLLRDTFLDWRQRQIPALGDRLVVSKRRLWVTGGICAKRRMTPKLVRAAVSARAGLSGSSASLDDLRPQPFFAFLFMFDTSRLKDIIFLSVMVMGMVSLGWARFISYMLCLRGYDRYTVSLVLLYC